MSLPIGENIRKLRLKRGITQEQLAAHLQLSYQAVSKWETGVTTPDSALLPRLAAYFEVTVDSLFEPQMTAYRNGAERLLAVYESTHADVDYERAEQAFHKLKMQGKWTDEDQLGYAMLADFRAQDFVDKALDRYQGLLTQSPRRGAVYWKAHRQLYRLLCRCGRGMEAIAWQKEQFEAPPDHPEAYASLALAYLYAGEPENALETVQRGMERFPEDALLLHTAGEIYRARGEVAQALAYWEQAFRNDPSMFDSLYAQAELLAETGRREEAASVLQELTGLLEQHGFEAELDRLKQALASLQRME